MYLQYYSYIKHIFLIFSYIFSYFLCTGISEKSPCVKAAPRSATSNDFEDDEKKLTSEEVYVGDPNWQRQNGLWIAIGRRSYGRR